MRLEMIRILFRYHKVDIYAIDSVHNRVIDSELYRILQALKASYSRDLNKETSND